MGQTVLQTVAPKPNSTALIKMPLSMEIDLAPGHIVLDGEWGPSSPTPKGAVGTAALSSFRPIPIVADGRPSQLLLNSCTNGRPKTAERGASERYLAIFLGRGSKMTEVRE